MDKNLLRKMKALLKMSREAVNENEATTAMRQLHALLAKHNIDMSQIDGPDAEEAVGETGFNSYIRPWVKIIANNVAELYFCQIYLGSRGRKVDIMVVGSEVNRHFASHMIQNIMHTINIASQREASEVYPKGPKWSSFQTSFLNAAALTIGERCQQLIKDAKHGDLQDETGKAMVLASVYDTHRALTTHFMNQLGLVTRKGRKKISMGSALGAIAGQEAGRKVPLTRSLQKKNSQKVLS